MAGGLPWWHSELHLDRKPVASQLTNYFQILAPVVKNGATISTSLGRSRRLKRSFWASVTPDRWLECSL